MNETNKKTNKVLLIVAAIVVAIVAIITLYVVIIDPADTVVYANFYTGDENNQNAEAVAIKDGKYMYVGTKDGAQKHIGLFTNVINNENNFGMSDIVDAHCHAYIDIENKYFGVDLTDLKEKDKYEEAVLEYINQNPGKDIYLGKG